MTDQFTTALRTYEIVKVGSRVAVLADGEVFVNLTTRELAAWKFKVERADADAVEAKAAAQAARIARRLDAARAAKAAAAIVPAQFELF